MPAASPWMDTWAPPQFIAGVATQQPAGALTNPSGPYGGIAVSASSNSNSVDTTLHWKLSGTIIVALIVIFGLQATGFRFVSSASIGIGR